MSSQNRPLSNILSVVAVATLSSALPDYAIGQDAQNSPTYKIVNPPSCTNNKGQAVRFIDSGKGRAEMAAVMAAKDDGDKPVVFRMNYAATTPEFQRFIDLHECAHHQTGDVDRPHPPRNGPEHLMNESISDCVAILRLRDEDGYDDAAFDKIAATMRNDMAKIGFPEISISSRISNIKNCFSDYGAPQEFIDGILKRRGLLRP